MKSILLALVIWTALAGLPVSAQGMTTFFDQEVPRMGFGLDTENPVWILEELIDRGMAFVRDHVEISKRYQKGTNGEDIQGELQIKVYPKGKTQSEESFRGNGSFEFSRPLGGLHLRFDFDFSPNPDDRRLEDYL